MIDPVQYSNFVLSLAMAEKDLISCRKRYHVSLVFDARDILVCYGVNTVKTNPKIIELGYKQLAQHSELNALIKIKRLPKIKKPYLVNYAFNNSLTRFCNSKPCQYCSAWVYDIFEQVIYMENNMWKTI